MGPVRVIRMKANSLSFRHGSFAEGFGHDLPLVFIDHVAGSLCSDFLYVDAVVFEDMGHLPNAGDMRDGVRLKPADTEWKLIPSERRWRLQILVEPCAKLVQCLGVGAGDVLRFQRLRRRLKNSQLDVALLVFAADYETDVFSLAGRIVPLQDEALVLGFDERKAAGNAGEDRAHTAPDPFDSFDEPELLLVESGIFGNREDNGGRTPLLQLTNKLAGGELVAGNGDAVFGIEVREVSEHAGELVAQARVGNELNCTGRVYSPSRMLR
jgi:hypothetical protein